MQCTYWRNTWHSSLFFPFIFFSVILEMPAKEILQSIYILYHKNNVFLITNTTIIATTEIKSWLLFGKLIWYTYGAVLHFSFAAEDFRTKKRFLFCSTKNFFQSYKILIYNSILNSYHWIIWVGKALKVHLSTSLQWTGTSIKSSEPHPACPWCLQASITTWSSVSLSVF